MAMLRPDAILRTAALLAAAASLLPAQVFRLSKEDLIEFTAQNPFERFADGRPRIPDKMLERARGLSAEEVWSVLPSKGFRYQYEDGFQILHPEMRLVGRAVTAQFMPARPDVEQVSVGRARKQGHDRFMNQAVIDMLQPGDVLVVDLFGKKDGGTVLGDNLFYYIMKATGNAGFVVDGAIRDLTGVANMPMPAYYRNANPTGISGVMLTGINIPVRIGNATVMPGDLVFGDREGVYFIPPHVVQAVLDKADETHIHDEWTRKKFDEGKYKSSEIYGSPKDPELKKEYQEYLKKRLQEIRK
jgi:regulator of RNase E activity RraA